MVSQQYTDRHSIRQDIPLIIVLLSGAFITILNQTLLCTALPPIMQDLQLSESIVQLLQSIFMLVNGIMIPITAFLVDRFTTWQLFIIEMSLFSLGTFVDIISSNFSLLLMAMVFQAAGAC